MYDYGIFFINMCDLESISKPCFKRKLINYIDINNYIDSPRFLAYFIGVLLIFIWFFYLVVFLSSI
jgi:hypothetical protein